VTVKAHIGAALLSCPVGMGPLQQLAIALVVALGGLGLGVVLWHIGPWGRASRAARAEAPAREAGPDDPPGPHR
jgi:hypothetical protein